MPLSMRPRVIQVDRGSRGFGLSLIYRGLDKFPENETGIFVARVVPGGQAQKYGVKENDKIISINNKTPRNVDDAVQIIKEAGKAIKLVVVRQEDVPDVVHDDNLSLQSEEQGWVSCENFDLLKQSVKLEFCFSATISELLAPEQDQSAVSTPTMADRVLRPALECKEETNSSKTF